MRIMRAIYRQRRYVEAGFFFFFFFFEAVRKTERPQDQLASSILPNTAIPFCDIP